MDDTLPIPNAGVSYPPPLLYVAGLVTGWLLHRAWPLRITVAAPTARTLVATLFVVAWIGIMVWALATFRRARTTLVPNRPASALATHGPYGVTRNPMYTSLVALYIGVSLFMNSWWPLFLLPLVVLAVQRFVIAREERYLTSAFPVDYPAYCQRVRRWL